MADMQVEGDELKKLVKLGKKKRLSFAFCPGPKNDHLILIDRRKKPEVLGKLAKKDGAGAKVAFGTFVLNAKTMELTCERVVPALAKVLKKYLKSQKVQVNVLVMDETGKVLDSDIEELPDDPAWDAEDPDDTDLEDDAPDSGEDTPAAAPDAAAQPEQAQAEAPQPDSRQQAAQLAGRLKAIQPALAAAPAPVATKLKKATELAVAQIRSADMEAAEKTVSALEKAAAKLGAAASDAPTSDAASDTAPAAESSADANAELRRLAARAAALSGVIADVPGPAGQKLTAALKQAAKQLKARQLEAAAALLDRIEAAVNRVATPPPPEAEPAAQTEPEPPAAPSPQAAKWEAVQGRLQPLVDQLIEEKRGDLAAINRFFNYAKEQAAEGNYDKALAAAGRTVALVREAQSAETTEAVQEARDAAPQNVVAYTRSRLNWIKTRQSLRGELEALKSAIDRATAGQEGMEDVPARSKVLFDYLDDIDTTLEDTLERLVETPDGARREGLKQEAREIIKEYLGVLDTDFFKAVDGNSFVRTNIRAGALAALQEVSTALKT